ncbi:hypothetical protein ACFOLJ_22260 [Rugamonas sp. CCM 8940]|uniref:hypothetical protein n=1 Tax=Rugamonas sp. CCM 8940 TaxID=2765359 RepID=UPI0018F46DCA|nr:hypothetical protein [Rugamonas sp. CCM 8940]MBJ7311447.1 hypothetical protein [Rugamonas sp. CCM 8940]
MSKLSQGGANAGASGGSKRYWFGAKTYGWGWGLPLVWQGWAVLLGYIALMLLGCVLFNPARSVLSFLLYVGVLNVLLLAICWRTGEPPVWRWGHKK